MVEYELSRVPLIPIELKEINISGEIPSDGIEAAYTPDAVAGLHNTLRNTGPLRFPVRIMLSRHDCDLIHNHIAEIVAPLAVLDDTHEALMRFTKKAALARDWINKMQGEKIGLRN